MFESLKNLLKHFTGSQNTESAEPVASNQESEPLSPAAVEQITESTTAETTPINSSLHAESTESVTNIEATQVSAATAINQETEVSSESESQSTPSDDNKSDT
jgi:hypothetical protein